MPVRLMIVDDHADMRYLIRAVVEDSGGAVIVAGEADGAEAALASIEAVDPDVVVLDALMPVVDGFEAAPMILERRPLQAILLCTGLLDSEVAARARRAGIAACLSKDDFASIPRVALELAAARR